MKVQDEYRSMAKTDRVGKDEKKDSKKRKREKEEKGSRDKSKKKHKSTNAAFSLLADEDRIDPTLSSLFAAKVWSVLPV